MIAISDKVCDKRGPGRPRDEEARKRILESAARLLEEVGLASVTIEAIAEHAGAGKATVYRWWPNKAAVLIEAFRETVASELPFPDTGSLAEDVRQQLQNFAAMLTGQRGRAFAAFLAAAQTDTAVAEAFRQAWIAPRRAEAKHALERHYATGQLRREVDLDQAIELLYAPLYYRLLTGFGEITPDYVDQLARTALSGLQARD